MPKRADEPEVQTAQKIQTQTQKTTTTGSKKKVSTDLQEGDTSVSYSISITKSLGNFEFLKIDAGVTLPLGASQTTLSEAGKLLVVAREVVQARVEADLVGITDLIK